MTRSLPKLLIHVTAVLLMLGGAAVAIASRSDAESPPPAKPLAEAVHAALSAPAPEGVSGRIEFRNNLVDAAALPAGGENALLGGAEGRFWMTPDGRARLELQSLAGDAQIGLDGDRMSLFDPASDTVYELTLPDAPREAAGGQLPTTGAVQLALGRLASGLALSDAKPGTVAGQAAYTVRLAPRHDGGLVGAAEVAWDAAHGVPLRAAVYAQGEREPVLEVEATEVDFGPVAERDVAMPRPAGARVVEVDDAVAGHGTVRGHGLGASAAFDAVQSELAFDLSAPKAVAGLPRRSLRTIKMDGRTGALATYGKGLGGLMVIEAPAGEERGGLAGRELPGLQELSLDGTTAYELATALGTVVQFERDGVAYTVIGSVPPAAAEAAARAL
jgi:hypothetical protein